VEALHQKNGEHCCESPDGEAVNYHYSLTLQWSEEEGAFRATLRELEECQMYGTMSAESVRNGQEAIELLIEKYKAGSSVA